MTATETVWNKTIGGYTLNVADPFNVGVSLNFSLRFRKPTESSADAIMHTLIISRDDVRTLRDSLSEWLEQGDSQ